MIATNDISEGEILFQIPRKCLLTPDNCAIAESIKKESIEGSSGWVPLLISLMYEYNNPESAWRPYLDLVPDFKELDLPMFWSSMERNDLLQGTGVIEAVNRDLTNIETEFNEIVLPYINKHSDKFSAVCKDIEFYKRMVAFVMSYSFTERAQQEEEADEDTEDSGSSPPMMVPMADILNHVAKNNAHLNFEKDALKMVAVKDIKKGEEVFNTYGELANLHLLHMYGFAERYPDNHWDTVSLYVSDIMEASKCLQYNTEHCLFDRKCSVVNELFGSNATITVGVNGVLEEQEMKTLLKICCADSTDRLQEIVDEDWEDDEDDDDISLEFKCSSDIPHNWKLLLHKSAGLCLKRYSTTLQEDDVSLHSASMLSTRQRYSLYTTYGQKQILKTMSESFT